ncbi:MAG: hypothetical protein O7B25_17020 [Gammaproteobacteria bacterium]|nr:hypothetical protein [Gammaproteobacteria bacterium]
MDQQPWNFEELHGSADPDLDSGETMTEYQTGIFYVALKLALDRLKHYSAATVS